MSSLSSALNIGGRAMFTQQSAISTTGHNLANVHTEGYSRQRLQLRAEQPGADGTGGGVGKSSISRIFDRFTDQKLVQEQSQAAVYQTREKFLSKVELVFNEMEGSGLRRNLNEFWDSWSLVANEPESDAARSKLQDRADALAARFRSMHSDLRSLRTESNARIAGVVSEINTLGAQIVDLNKQVVRLESNGANANDARDERQKLLEKISELVDVQWYENERGEMKVSIGNGWTLTESNQVRPLQVSLNGGEVGMYNIIGVGDNEYKRDLTHELRSGELKETLETRDKTLVGYMNKLDDMAFGLSSAINRLHATGTGLNSGFTTLKSGFGLNPQAQAQPLPYLKDGTLQWQLVNQENNTLETYEIEVQAGVDSLQDIVSRMNDTVGDSELFHAEIQPDGSLQLDAGGGHKFIFTEDTSDLTLVMGLNTFFQSLKGAEDIQLSDRIKADPNSISTGRELIPGDNQVALAIAKLQNQPTMNNDSVTFDEFYNDILADVGLRMQRNQTDKEHQDNLVDQFKQIRNSVSSVNMDEEMANMVQQQKAYQASAKYLSTINEMMDTVIRM